MSLPSDKSSKRLITLRLRADCCALQIFDLSLDFSASGVVTGIYLAPETQEWAKERYRLIIKGLYGMPVNLPGSDLRKGVDAKNELLQVQAPAGCAAAARCSLRNLRLLIRTSLLQSLCHRSS